MASVSNMVLSQESWRQNVPRSGNFTKQQYINSYMAYAAVYLVLLILCTFGSAMIVTLRILDKRTSSTSCYVIAIAIADLFFVWFGFPNFLWNVSARLDLPYYTPENKEIFYMTRAPVVWFQETSMILSDWLLVVFSLERLLVIRDPFKFKFLKRSKYARINIVTVFMLSLIFTFFNLLNYFCLWKGNLYDKRELRPPWLLNWEPVQQNAEVICRLGVFLILMVLNTALILHLRYYESSQTISKHRHRSQPKENRSVVILLSSVLLFIICRVPSVIYSCLIIADHNRSFDFTPSAKLFYTPIVNGIQYVNYSVTFYVYLAVDKKCREEMRRLCEAVLPSVQHCCHGVTQRFTSSRSRSTHQTQVNSAIGLEEVSGKLLGSPGNKQDE